MIIAVTHTWYRSARHGNRSVTRYARRAVTNARGETDGNLSLAEARVCGRTHERVPEYPYLIIALLARLVSQLQRDEIHRYTSYIYIYTLYNNMISFVECLASSRPESASIRRAYFQTVWKICAFKRCKLHWLLSNRVTKNVRHKSSAWENFP